MATQANSFANLLGAGNNAGVPGTSKKSKAKAKAKAAASTPAPPANGGASSSGAGAAAATNPDTPLTLLNAVVEVDEAKAILERAAREAKALSDKHKLWKEWTRQATDRSGKAIKYRDTDGSFVDFKQVVLRSRALEITIEGCVSAGLTADRQSTLAQLLAAILPVDSGLVDALAGSLVRLSGLMADESPDTIMGAQRAVHNTVAALKSAGSSESSPVAAWLGRVATIDKELARQQGNLQKMVITNKGTITKETTLTAKALVKLQQEKFDMLQPENVPVVKVASGALGAGLRSLDDLTAVINSHLTDVDNKGASGSSRSNAAGFKREEDLLQQQANAVGSQIRTLEAQLRSLRAQQQEITEKLGQVSSKHGSSWESAGGKAKPPGLSASHYREELAVVDGIKALVDPSTGGGGSAEQVQAVQATQLDAPLSYAAHSEQLLGMSLKALGEVPGKINFCKQRIDKAGKLAQLGAAVGDKLITDSKKQHEEAEKLLSDTMRMAEDLVSTSVQVRSDVHSRYEAMLRFSPDTAKAIEQHLRNIDELAQQVQQQYSAILAGPSAAPAPAAPAVGVYTPHASAAASPAPARGAGGRGPRAASVAPGLSKPTTNGTAPTLAPASLALSAAAPPAAPVALLAAVAPAPAAPALRPVPAAPARSWGKIEAVVTSPDDAALPTPAEAFKVAGPSGSIDDGLAAVASKRKDTRRPKA